MLRNGCDIIKFCQRFIVIYQVIYGVYVSKCQQGLKFVIADYYIVE